MGLAQAVNVPSVSVDNLILLMEILLFRTVSENLSSKTMNLPLKYKVYVKFNASVIRDLISGCRINGKNPPEIVKDKEE